MASNGQMHVGGACPPDGVKANRLLFAMEAAAFEQLHPKLELVSLGRQEVLYEAGDTITHAYFPTNCVISLLSVLSDGNSAEIATFGCEGVAAYNAAIASGEAYGRYIVQMPGTAVKVPVRLVADVAVKYPRVDALLKAFLAAFMRQVFQSVACNACHPVEARCCRWLLSIADRVKTTDLPLTHEFLAEMLGVQRSTVSLILKSLQAKQLIEQGRSVLRIKDRVRLEQGACECYDNIRENFKKRLPKTYSD